MNAYCQLGHGARVVLSYTQQLFHLTAVMYLNDTDLLHWPPLSAINSEDLVEHVQQAMTDYRQIAVTSKGIL